MLLSDGTRGKVVHQTPEVVELVLLGGSRKTYRTEDYIGQSPTNLSTNFRIRSTFGVDYQHQRIATTEIPKLLQNRLQKDFEAAGFAKPLLNLKVEFKNAGASSLDLEVIADFSGKAAQEHELLLRLIQRICVDSCNDHGWQIPFTQVTVHEAK